MKRAYFGEGTERLVRKFREVDADGNFVGPALVAKERRFMEDLVSSQGQMVCQFHRRFCDTQARAQKLAHVFNEKLSQVPSFIPGVTPTIDFLDCAVYMVRDVRMGEVGVLVEKQLDPRAYKKWNDNAGFVDGQAKAEMLLGAKTELDGIEDSDEEETDDSEKSEEDATRGDPEISVADIPQAFSHFTYRYTQRRVLVCDLQGMLSSDTGSPKFEFTDPVIHFCSRTGRRSVFGRTDRGKAGVSDFFRSHKCGVLCRMINRTWIRKVGQQQRMQHVIGAEEPDHEEALSDMSKLAL
jgi:hypothetical protein